VAVVLLVALSGAAMVVHASSEEHVENLLRVDLVFKVVLPVMTSASAGRLLLITRLLTRDIIDPALLRVSQAGIGSTDLLEGFTGLRGMVLIRVELDSQFLVGLLDLILLGVSLHSQNLVVVLLRKDIATPGDLLGRVLRLGWLGSWLRLSFCCLRRG